MPRSFDMSTDYGVTVEEVLRAFSDEEYWLARLADSMEQDLARILFELFAVHAVFPDSNFIITPFRVRQATRLY